jgi:hypothetical protein
MEPRCAVGGGQQHRWPADRASLEGIMGPEHPPAAHDLPLEELERTLIGEFLLDRGYDAQALAAVSAEARERLLREAALYASARLSEVEARSHLVHDLHGPGRRKKPAVEDYLRSREKKGNW